MHQAGYKEDDDVTPSSFYREYVSKSLPLHLKGYCKHWELFEQVQVAIENDMKSEETKRTRENFEMLMQDMFEVNLPESFSMERSNTVSEHHFYILTNT